MAEERVVVERHLRVEREHPSVPRHEERVHLGERRVGVDVGAKEGLHERDRPAERVAREIESEGEPARLEREEPEERIGRLPKDRGGVLRRDLLDLHPAGSRGDHDREGAGAVEGHAEIELAVEVERLLDEHLPDDPAGGAGLRRHEGHAENRPGVLERLVRVRRDPDAAAFSPSARVNLRLHDGGSSEPLRDLARALGRVGDLAARHGDPVPREDRLGLVLVDLHGVRSSRVVTDGNRRGGLAIFAKQSGKWRPDPTFAVMYRTAF